MASSYSTNLKIELQATGENSGTWGTITNTNLGTALEQAVVGYGNPSYASDANLTLTYTDTNAAQAARALVLNVTSAVSLTATRELVVPTIQKQYIVQNNTTGSQSITVKTSGGTGITVTSGRKAHLYVNGTDVIFMDDFVDINGGAIDGTTIGASSASTGAFSTLSATGNINFDGGTFTFNDSGADKDFRVEGDTDANLLFSDASTDRIGVGTSTPATKLDVNGTITATAANVATVNVTTLDATNIEVTNLKAKDGTAAGSIADSTGVVTLASSVLTTTDINGGTIDGTTIGGSSAAAGTFTTLTASSIATFSAGSAAAPSITTTGDTNTGIFFPAADTIAFTEGGTESMRISSSGNLGLGVTPSAWATEWKALQLGLGASISGRTDSATWTEVMANSYRASDSTYKYIANDFATRALMGQSGQHQWFTAPSGTAGNTITFTQAMTLDASGNLALGGTTNKVTGLSGGGTGLTIQGSAAPTLALFDTDNAGYYSNIGQISENAYYWNIANGFLSFGTNNTERARIDSSGNLGLGVTPSAWVSTSRGLQVGSAASLSQQHTGATNLMSNAYEYSSSAFKYIVSAFAGRYNINPNDGAHSWYTAASGTAGNAITFTQAMKLSDIGQLEVFATSGNGGRIDVFSNAQTNNQITLAQGFSLATDNIGYLYNRANTDFVFGTNNAERARITAAGLLLVGITTGTTHFIKRDTSDTVLTVSGNGGVDSVYINSVNATGANLGSAAAIFAQKNNASGRSISAAGTVNASGADYAEYMLKVGNFVIAKGDLCGIDANGKLTNVFADSVSFVVKSTNPSYVGGDTWANEELIGKKPTNENELVEWYDRAEESRQKVDRIAFSGQVPVNVLGATPGQYIVPINDNGAIKGVAVRNPTFEQYQSAVGKVIAVQDDGRALIIVKVA